MALTPVVLEYGPEHPWLHPTADHDVIAGTALDTGIGYLTHPRERSLLLAPFGNGVFVGYSKRF